MTDILERLDRQKRLTKALHDLLKIPKGSITRMDHWVHSLEDIKTLIDEGANINEPDENGFDILGKVISNATPEVQKLLVPYLAEHGADIHIKGAFNQNALLDLTKSAPEVQIYLIPYLLEHRADIYFSLYSLLRHGAPKAQKTLVPYLVEHGADVNEGNEGNYGNRPLHMLMEHSTLEAQKTLVPYLVEHGADVNAKTMDGKTPLHFLMESRNVMDCRAPEAQRILVPYLIEHGADVNAKTMDGKTPLHFLMESRILMDRRAPEAQKTLVPYLIEHGADVNAKTKDGETPLHFLMKHGTPEAQRILVPYLMGHGADVNAKTKDGETPLYTLAKHGTPEAQRILVPYLVEHGADFNPKTLLGILKDQDHFRPLLTTLMEIELYEPKTGLRRVFSRVAGFLGRKQEPTHALAALAHDNGHAQDVKQASIAIKALSPTARTALCAIVERKALPGAHIICEIAGLQRQLPAPAMTDGSPYRGHCLSPGPQP